MADPIIETLATILVMDYVSCCNTCWMHAHCDIREKIHNYTKHLSILPLKVCVVEVFIIDLLVSSSKYFVCNVYVLVVQKILSNAFLIMNNFFAHIYLNFDFFGQTQIDVISFVFHQICHDCLYQSLHLKLNQAHLFLKIP